MDIEGKENFRTIKRYYSRGANCILFIYDVTNSESFKKIENLNKEVLMENNYALRILIGNKIDKPNRVITEEEGRSLANGLEMNYFFETSAKTGQNVNEEFKILIMKIIREKNIKKNYFINNLFKLLIKY